MSLRFIGENSPLFISSLILIAAYYYYYYCYPLLESYNELSLIYGYID